MFYYGRFFFGFRFFDETVGNVRSRLMDELAQLVDSGGGIGGGRRADLLNVIQRHIAQSMEADRQAQAQFQSKCEELARAKELTSKLQNELMKVLYSVLC